MLPKRIAVHRVAWRRNEQRASGRGLGLGLGLGGRVAGDWPDHRRGGSELTEQVQVNWIDVFGRGVRRAIRAAFADHIVRSQSPNPNPNPRDWSALGQRTDANRSAPRCRRSRCRRMGRDASKAHRGAPSCLASKRTARVRARVRVRVRVRRSSSGRLAGPQAGWFRAHRAGPSELDRCLRPGGTAGHTCRLCRSYRTERFRSEARC